jgi:hypothetical protein
MIMTKIYTPDISIEYYEKIIKNIKKIKKEEIKEIYSLNGIYQIKNNELYKIKITNDLVKETTHKKNKFIIDESKIILEEYYNIPQIHELIEIIVEEYTINEEIKIIVKRKENKIIDGYFLYNKGKIDFDEINKLIT